MTSALRPKRGEGLGCSREDSQGPQGQTGAEPSTQACCWKALRIQPCKSLLKIAVHSRTSVDLGRLWLLASLCTSEEPVFLTAQPDPVCLFLNKTKTPSSSLIGGRQSREGRRVEKFVEIGLWAHWSLRISGRTLDKPTGRGGSGGAERGGGGGNRLVGGARAAGVGMGLSPPGGGEGPLLLGFESANQHLRASPAPRPPRSSSAELTLWLCLSWPQPCRHPSPQCARNVRGN